MILRLRTNTIEEFSILQSILITKKLIPMEAPDLPSLLLIWHRFHPTITISVPIILFLLEIVKLFLHRQETVYSIFLLRK